MIVEVDFTCLDRYQIDVKMSDSLDLKFKISTSPEFWSRAPGCEITLTYEQANKLAKMILEEQKPYETI